MLHIPCTGTHNFNWLHAKWPFKDFFLISHFSFSAGLFVTNNIWATTCYCMVFDTKWKVLTREWILQKSGFCWETEIQFCILACLYFWIKANWKQTRVGLTTTARKLETARVPVPQKVPEFWSAVQALSLDTPLSEQLHLRLHWQNPVY